MKHSNRLAALALSLSMGISGCALAPASSASSETVTSTYEEKIENGETVSSVESAENPPEGSTITTAHDSASGHPADSPEQSSESAEESDSETEAEKTAAFAQKIKKAVAAADVESLADLCGYPVCITLESGDGQELETRQDLTALGAETLFTQNVKDTIAAVQESELDSCGAGVMMGENGTIVFNDVNGNLMITGINLSD